MDAGSYDNCTYVTVSTPVTDFTCGDTGIHQLMLIVEDANGNYSTCESQVIISPDMEVFNFELDIALGATGIAPGNRAVVGNYLYFSLTDTNNITRLYRYLTTNDSLELVLSLIHI